VALGVDGVISEVRSVSDLPEKSGHCPKIALSR